MSMKCISVFCAPTVNSKSLFFTVKPTMLNVVSHSSIDDNIVK